MHEPKLPPLLQTEGWRWSYLPEVQDGSGNKRARQVAALESDGKIPAEFKMIELDEEKAPLILLENEVEQVMAKIQENGWNVFEETVETLIRYKLFGTDCGGFLEAVLSNDLLLAIQRADVHNEKRLGDIVRVIYNYLPHNCHGSKRAYDEWKGIIGVGI